ncbi:MAG: helix-turn-helix transcriptional regulator [Pseudomonadota bacterium]
MTSKRSSLSPVSVRNYAMPNAPTFPTFGKRLRRLRRCSGLKQSAFAELQKVDQATVSRWESGVQCPDSKTQQAAFNLLAATGANDSALKRLVEQAGHCVHLVDEASHTCLAYSRHRAMDWETGGSELLGTSLWQFATDEIRQAESELASHGWWDLHMPEPKSFVTSELVHDEIRISAGPILWERIYLSDGTPARLVSAATFSA